MFNHSPSKLHGGLGSRNVEDPSLGGVGFGLGIENSDLHQQFQQRLQQFQQQQPQNHHHQQNRPQDPADSANSQPSFSASLSFASPSPQDASLMHGFSTSIGHGQAHNPVHGQDMDMSDAHVPEASVTNLIAQFETRSTKPPKPAKPSHISAFNRASNALRVTSPTGEQFTSSSLRVRSGSIGRPPPVRFGSMGHQSHSGMRVTSPTLGQSTDAYGGRAASRNNSRSVATPSSPFPTIASSMNMSSQGHAQASALGAVHQMDGVQNETFFGGGAMPTSSGNLDGGQPSPFGFANGGNRMVRSMQGHIMDTFGMSPAIDPSIDPYGDIGALANLGSNGGASQFDSMSSVDRVHSPMQQTTTMGAFQLGLDSKPTTQFVNTPTDAFQSLDPFQAMSSVAANHHHGQVSFVDMAANSSSDPFADLGLDLLSDAEQNPPPLPVRPSQQGSRPSREQVPAEAWESMKTIIRQLYLEERKPLKEVIQVMADRHGFQATPKMYKTRFSQWGFVKNNTEDEVKKLLSMKFQRDAEGKVSEFVRNGRVINLGTYLKRKGVTEYDLVDFETPADLPTYVRCRTPTPPPAPGYLRSPDLLRAQETVVGNMRKAFLHCRQSELDTKTTVGWSMVMVWGSSSSELLYEANKRVEAGDAGQGEDLIEAFKQLEVDLQKLSPQGIKEVLLGMVHRDPGMMTALSKYLAAYSATNYERLHPYGRFLRRYELESIYGRRHPYVARTWIDLSMFYQQANSERLESLIAEYQPLGRSIESKEGTHSAEDFAFRYTMLQLLHAANPQSPVLKSETLALWDALKQAGRASLTRSSDGNTYCVHDAVKVTPWTKRCKDTYSAVAELLKGILASTLSFISKRTCTHRSMFQTPRPRGRRPWRSL
ncbi:unnamed protein product [Parascedosporium putredinis]|uniref:Clr5 domain-containing protein n=1 Tax=Parascedosporium putredinis TaxID=1442378 RepID=A0A9P1M958_9PEZI|nr:unnamed protein product [Parascedosporium putredinis]CAI7991258.1 unnamed protein product [Parascedosporium putredinis]